MDDLRCGANGCTLKNDAKPAARLPAVALLEDEPSPTFPCPDTSVWSTTDDDLVVFHSGETFKLVGERPRREAVSLAEAQHRAPFTVLMPSRVPANWRIQFVYIERTRRPVSPPTVAIELLFRGTQQPVIISQSSATEKGSVFDELIRNGGWSETTDDGKVIYFRQGGHQAQVYLERAGTSASLMAETLSINELLKIATGLIPAPTIESL